MRLALTSYALDFNLIIGISCRTWYLLQVLVRCVISAVSVSGLEPYVFLFYLMVELLLALVICFPSDQQVGILEGGKFSGRAPVFVDERKIEEL